MKNNKGKELHNFQFKLQRECDSKADQKRKEKLENMKNDIQNSILKQMEKKKYEHNLRLKSLKNLLMQKIDYFINTEGMINKSKIQKESIHYKFLSQQLTKN